MRKSTNVLSKIVGVSPKRKYLSIKFWNNLFKLLIGRFDNLRKINRHSRDIHGNSIGKMNAKYGQVISINPHNMGFMYPCSQKSGTISSILHEKVYKE